jgi:PST family polysaccharide transporter
LVNEQTEVGVLLALPGLLATLVFSPWVIRIFYTSKFLPAADLLPWFVLGVCGRVISWPIAFIQLAKGASRMFAVTETASSLLYMALIWLGLRWLGLRGVAIAFVLLYASYTGAMLWVAAHLSGFRWSKSASRLLATTGGLVAAAYAALVLLPPAAAAMAGAVLVAAGGIYSTRQLTARLGRGHRISIIVSSLPLVGQFLAA